jgi:hypothetical protein
MDRSTLCSLNRWRRRGGVTFTTGVRAGSAQCAPSAIDAMQANPAGTVHAAALTRRVDNSRGARCCDHLAVSSIPNVKTLHREVIVVRQARIACQQSHPFAPLCDGSGTAVFASGQAGRQMRTKTTNALFAEGVCCPALPRESYKGLNAMRRFFALPSGVVLSATGVVSPNPAAFSRSAGTFCEIRYATAAFARATESR